MNTNCGALGFMEWGGMAAGLLGAALLSFNSTISGYGFLFFLASNVFWIYASAMRRNFALLSMMSAFCLTSLFGIYSWFLK